MKRECTVAATEMATYGGRINDGKQLIIVMFIYMFCERLYRVHKLYTASHIYDVTHLFVASSD